MTVGRQDFHQWTWTEKPKQVKLTGSFQDIDIDTSFQFESSPWFGWFAGTHLRHDIPTIEHSFDQHLDPPASCFSAIEPRGNDAGVVQDQQIPGIELHGKFEKPTVSNPAGVSIETQQAAGTAVF